MKNGIDLTEVLKREHEDKWVALSDDYKKVVDFSGDLVALKKRVDETKRNVVYIKVPMFGISYAFTQD